MVGDRPFALVLTSPRQRARETARLGREMTLEEIAEALGVSKRTAEGDWYFARAWLQDQL